MFSKRFESVISDFFVRIMSIKWSYNVATFFFDAFPLYRHIIKLHIIAQQVSLFLSRSTTGYRPSEHLILKSFSIYRCLMCMYSVDLVIWKTSAVIQLHLSRINASLTWCFLSVSSISVYGQLNVTRQLTSGNMK